MMTRKRFMLAAFLCAAPALFADAAFDTALAEANIGWWRDSWDGDLASYIEEGIAHNAGAALLEIRLRQARKIEDAARAGAFPLVAAGAGYSYFVNPRDPGALTINPAPLPLAPVSVSLPNIARTVGIFNFPVAASWEIDLFGKRKDRARAARADTEALRHELRGAYVALAASIAAAYLNLVKLDAELELAGEALSLFERLVEDAERRAARGAAAGTEIYRVKQERNAAAMNRDALLLARADLYGMFLETLGRGPDGESAEIPRLGDLAPAPAPPEITASSLSARPDVMAAQAKREAADINAKAVRKEFFPALTLTGALLFGAPLIKDEAGVLSFSGSGLVSGLSIGTGMTVFDGGRRRAAEGAANLEAEAAAKEYAKTAASSARDLRASLLRLRTAALEHALAAENAKLEEAAYAEHEKQLSAGLISDALLLRARLALVASKQALASAAIDARVAAVGVYAASGGGR